MSLNTSTKATSSDELLQLNLKNTASGATNKYFTPGQTISYSFFTQADTSIFNNYRNDFGINATFDGDIWGSNANWGADVNSALTMAAEIINLNFSASASFSGSDIRWTAVNDLSGSSTTGISFVVPSYDMDGKNDGDDAGIVLFNKSPFHTGTVAESELGGSNERTITILHEFGHFLGLAHPHASVPADAPFIELNDNKYDLMSYKYSDDSRKVIKTDTGGGGFSINSAFNFGNFVNYTPINLASLQYLYGANTSTHVGGTSYMLTDAKTTARDLDGSDGTISIGRAYYTVWDNGGTDEIRYAGANRALLNLNTATLDRNNNDVDLVETLGRVSTSDYYATLFGDYRSEITDAKYYAGGFFSQILTNDDSVSINGPSFGGKYANTLGGYVIAKGVVVENATGGSGNDLIIGNHANNILTGNGGNDTFFDENGHDTVNGGAGNDVFYIGKGNDTVEGGTGTDKADFNSAVGNYQIYVAGTTVIIQDITGIKYGSNTFTNVESFTFTGGNLALASLPVNGEFERLYADNLNNEMVNDAGGLGGNINDTFWGTTGVDNFFGELLNDFYTGNTGTDGITFKGNKADFSFTKGDGTQLVVTNIADATKFDILHSVEQLTFDDGLTAVTAADLGLTGAEFTTWQTDYDFG
uniref:Peptidase M10 serralysin C-terminal domain-containing protein n=1 Tax=OCS116 cluster bacterium TaxID=2030921 RepID=A0A2A4Z182_9PROT